MSGWWSNRTLRMWTVLSLLIIIHASANAERNSVEQRIRPLLEELKKRMGITQEIRIVMVPENNLIVSVRPLRELPGVFEMSLEESFVEKLDQDDLRAVLAHELGHVWIFTHHPYLQTEDLANSIAFRAVPQTALDRVYEKVRDRLSAGSLAAAQ